jgi:hypothetical protein
MIFLRNPRFTDLDWICDELKKFSSFLKTKNEMMGDREYVKALIMRVADEHIFLVAESEKTGLMGFISALATPHLFNPKIKTICIVVWWVADKYRNSRAGSMLLKEVIRVGKEQANWISLAINSNCPIKEAALKNLGFQTAEINHIMEVG